MDESFDELKKKAAEYYANNKVPERLEEILNDMFYEDPKDINGRLAEFFEKFALPPTVSDLKCKRILSSSGDLAIKCCVRGMVKNHSQMLGTSQISLSHEKNHFKEQEFPENVEAPSEDEIFESNRKNVNEYLSEKLSGVSLLKQSEIDQVLSDWMNDVEEDMKVSSTPCDLDDRANTTPTPSSGKKKKAPSAKKGGKGSDKPVPPREPPENRATGYSSIFAVSTAALNASSSFLNRDPFSHLHYVLEGGEGCHSNLTFTMPTVAMTIFTGGKFSPGKLNLFKNVFVIASPSCNIRDSVKKLTDVYCMAGKPPSAKGAGLHTGPLGAYQPPYDKVEQPLDAILEAINSLGFVPGQDVYIGLEAASQEIFDYDKGKYEVMSGALKTADDMIELYKDLVARYPALIMIINPLRKEDREQWPKLAEFISERCFVIGGEAIYGSLHKLNVNSLTARPSSGIALRNGGRVTCSDMHRIVNDVQAMSGVTILTSSADDACDDIYSDLAVGLGIDFVRFGAPSRGEQTSRINRLVEIEESLECDEMFKVNYRNSFSFPPIKIPPPPEVADADEMDPAPVSTPDSKGKKK